MSVKYTRFNTSVITLFRAKDPARPDYTAKFEKYSDLTKFLSEHPDAKHYNEYEHTINIYVHSPYHVESELFDKIKSWAETFVPEKKPYFYSTGGDYNYDYGTMKFSIIDNKYLKIILINRDVNETFNMNGLLEILNGFGEVKF